MWKIGGHLKEIQGVANDFGWLRQHEIKQQMSQYNNFLAKRLEDSDKHKTVVNVGKVEIRNQFRENLEPDRIAVAIKDTFLKKAQAITDTRFRSQVYSPGIGG